MTTPGAAASATVARQLLISSRPVSWINTAYPFAAAYLLTTREIDATLVIGTLFFLVPYNLAMYGINDVFDYESDLRNPRKGGAHGAVLDVRLHRITLWAAALACLPFVVYLVVVGSPLVVAGARGEPLLRRVLQRAAAAAEGGAVRRLADQQHPLLLPRGLRARAGRRGLDVAARRRHRRVRAVGRRLARLRRGAGCRRRPRGRHPLDRDRPRAPAGRSASHSAATPRRASTMLVTPWPGPLAAVVALPYLALVWPFRNVDR